MTRPEPGSADPPPRVFLSYARTDGEHLATALRRRLEGEHPEITLWQDRARLEGGVGWWRQIAEALETVQFLVLIMTPAALRSEVAQKEWLYARHRGVCVYPVKVETSGPIDFATLPAWMRKAHFFDLAKEWDTFVNYLKSPCRAPRVPFMAPDLPANYVSRQALHDDVRTAVLRPTGGRLALTTALVGAGGLGKTTLAASLCHDPEIMSRYDDGVLWITLGKDPNLVEAIGKPYRALTGRPPAFIDKEDGEYQLAGLLEDRTCLIVIDDVWDAAHLRPFLRGGPSCFRLITTRLLEIAADCARATVDEMTGAEAVRLLAAGLEHGEEELGAFRRLAHRLGEWPLLLELANAALRQRLVRSDSLQGALEYLARKLDKQGVVAFDARNASERQQAIARTLDLSLELLDEVERERCTTLAVFPEDADVPLEAVQALWGVDAFEAEELLQTIDNTSLVRFDVRGGTIRVHDVVRAYLETRTRDPRQLHARLADALTPERASTYAWRWRTYHLIHGDRADAVRQALLDFGWMRGKLAATDLSELIAEYDRFPEDETLASVGGVLRLASPVLLTDPSQLPAQMLGRLPNPESAPRIQGLLDGIRAWEATAWLEPLSSLLTPPGGALRMTLSGHSGPVLDVAALDGDQRLVSAGADGTVRLWDVALGKAVRTLAAHSDWVRTLAKVPGTARAVSVSDDGTLRVWDLDRAQALACVATPGEEIAALVLGPEGRTLLTLGRHTLKRWDVQTDTLLEEVPWAGAPVTVATAAQSLMVFATEDATLVACEATGLAEPRWLSRGGHRVRALAVHPATQQVVAATASGALLSWDMGRAESVPRVLTDDAGMVSALAVGPSETVAGTDDGRVTVWDRATGQCITRIDGHDGAVNAVTLLDSARLAVSAADDSTIRVWALDRPAQVRPPAHHATAVRAVCFSPDGSAAFATSDYRELSWWDPDTTRPLARLRGDGIWDVASAAPVAVAGGPTSGLHAWGTGEAEGACRVIRGRNALRGLEVFTRTGRVIWDAGVRLSVWDHPRRVGVFQTDLGGEAVRRLAISAGARSIAFADLHSVVRTWQVGTHGVQPVADTGADVVGLAVAGDGATVAAATADGRLLVWRLDARRGPVEVATGIAGIAAVALSADGALLATAGPRLSVWRLAVGERVADYTSEAPMLACAWHPTRPILVAGDEEGYVHFLRLRGRDAASIGR